MATVSCSRFRTRLSEHLELSRREPVTISSRGVRRRAVLVSADFYDRALAALGDEPYAPPARTPEQELRDETDRYLGFF
ncbi:MULTISPECIES: type II toxin-antitoxin system Phd/YefM family antitoxin [Brachybacterium]|uniref:Antitoxin n=1 Tax=Brachybacterium rhamnosum TaxID=173361 RepID=A0ABW4PXJ2_9MICO|nr:type II toxin-antitoxin system Phd/YefM family antitoxin [Brachybacterium squillarum]MCW1805060.1 type II toxin-antitoxin system Phd/YefM family antitoxin [Brachybacterium squillarum]